MKHLDKVLEMVERELGSIAKGGEFRSREDVDVVYKLVDVVKDIYCIWKEDDGSYESYGRDGGYNADGYGGYERRRRDSMGRFRDGGPRTYRRSYREDGTEEFKEKLREMMEEAPDEQTKKSIERMMQNM